MQKNAAFLSGAIGGLLAVVLGAFGAHGLESVVDTRMLQRFHTGVEYQFYHALALMVTGLIAQHWTSQPSQKWLQGAGFAFLIGIILFSGSLYLYVLTGERRLGMITPVGGVSFIVGWFCLMVVAWKNKPAEG